MGYIQNNLTYLPICISIYPEASVATQTGAIMARVMVFDQTLQPTQEDLIELLGPKGYPFRLFHVSFDTKDVVGRSSRTVDISGYGHYGCDVWIREKAEPYFFSAISVLGMQILFERVEESEKVALFRKKHPLLSWVREWFYKMFVAAIGPAEHA